MYRKGIIIIIWSVFAVFEAVSQQISHQVLTPAAGIAVGGGANYSQTIGEAVVEITGMDEFILTQGFQQPRIKLQKGTPPPGTGVKVYPNPVEYFVNLELFGQKDRTFQVSIINIGGTVVFSDEISFTGSYWDVREISVSQFSRGFYFVRVVSTDGVISRTFKIEKM